MPKLIYPGHLRQRGDGWEWLVSVGGKRHSLMLYGTKGEVVQQAKDRHEELVAAAKRKKAGLPGRVRVSELIERYERERLVGRPEGTQKVYATTLKKVRAYFIGQLDDPYIDQIQPGHVSAFLAWRGAQGVSATTVSNDRSRLRTVFTYAEGIQLRVGNPVNKATIVPHDDREAVILSDAEYERLLAETAEEPMLNTYTLLLGETGMRCNSEVLRLRWVDLDTDTEPGWIHVPALVERQRTKSGKGRRVPMTPRLRQALRAHILRFRGARYRGRTSPWVLHHTVNHPAAPAGSQIARFDRWFNEAAERAELPTGFVQHDLRHRRVTTWLAEGHPLAKVMMAVGHEDLATTQRYMHLVHGHLATLVEEDLASLVGRGA